MPLELGEHISKRKTFAVPASLDDVQEPDWHSRLWSSPSRMDKMWPRRNLCRSRYSFHHNLLHIFKVSELYDKHPDWFPLLRGKRFRPPDDDSHAWQPCLASKEAAHYAAQKIIAHFDKHPEATSFSIGVNDSHGYCQCPACKALDDPAKPTFRDRPNWSNRFFTFANRVAEETARKHPDKLIGCLAYACCEEVPSFPVHPNIIPYLTNDRSQWRDPEFRATDQELLTRWSRAARQLGVYDYYYGSGYVIPRVYPHVSAESIKFCHKIGVRAWYAEIYSNWALDGPKAWVASQLLWDTGQDVDALLDDYYRNFFGAAADPMRRYWAECERIWESQGGEAHWFKGFFDAAQFELFPPDTVKRLYGFLDRAERQARSDIVRRRVAFYRKGLRYCELCSTVYHADRHAAATPIGDEAGLRKAAARVNALLETSVELERFERDVVMKDPLLKPCIPFRERCRNFPSVCASSELARVVDRAIELDRKGAVRGLVAALASRKDLGDEARVAKAMLRWLDDPAAVRHSLVNRGFEADAPTGARQDGIDWSTSGTPPGWASWVRPATTAKLEWVAKDAHGGKQALRIADATAACYCQSVPVKPGEVYVAKVHAQGRVSGRNDTTFWVQWKDAKGRWFTEALKRSARLPQGATQGWVTMHLAFAVPEGAAFAVVGCGANRQEPGDYALFDDCSLTRLDAH